jgi:orotate phosphoribosyltransferase
MKFDVKKEMSDFVAKSLLYLGAIKIRKEKETPFEYTSKNKGPIYIDNRIIVSYSIFKKIIAGFFGIIISQVLPYKGYIFGGATAGMSFAEQVADLLYLPYLYIRKVERTHGITSAIAGDTSNLTRYPEAVLVEDLITDGKSKLYFLRQIKDVGLVCKHCLVVLDREQGGKEALEKVGVTLHSLTTLQDTLKIAKDTRFISENTYEYIQQYLTNPKQWAIDKGYLFYD